MDPDLGRKRRPFAAVFWCFRSLHRAIAKELPRLGLHCKDGREHEAHGPLPDVGRHRQVPETLVHHPGAPERGANDLQAMVARTIEL